MKRIELEEKANEIAKLYYSKDTCERLELRDRIMEVVDLALTIPVVMHWVAVKEALPDNETKTYLVVRDGEVAIETWYYRDGKGYWYNYLGITDWKEIPEPPCA